MTSSSKKTTKQLWDILCLFAIQHHYQNTWIPGELTPTLIGGVVILFRRIITLYKSISNMKHLKEIAVVIC